MGATVEQTRPSQHGLPTDSYTLVDSTIGSRVILAFLASPDAVQARLPKPWVIQPYTGGYAAAMGATTDLPNLLVVFNDLLLNQDAAGHPQADPHACYVGFNIPATNPETAASGMVHFRIFTGSPESVPGRYLDSLPATVVRESRIQETGAEASVFENFTITSTIGGELKFQMQYQRGPLLRLTADRPNFPVWAAADPTIVRVYQEDSLMDTIRHAELGIDRVHRLTFEVSIAELADLFDGTEQLMAILANPNYSRRVFHPTKSEPGRTS